MAHPRQKSPRSRLDPIDRRILKAIKDRPEVAECLLVTGASDYLLRIWIEDIEALREFITNALQGIPCVAETSTMLVLNETRGSFAGLG